MNVERVCSKEQLESILDLICGYQEFYKVRVEKEQNREYFSQFLSEISQGALFGCWEGGGAMGFLTLYFLPSSLSASVSCVLNDLFVHPVYRGNGVARALMLNANRVALEKGFKTIEWMAQKQNERAQRFYNPLPHSRSEWFYYSSKTSELDQHLSAHDL